MCQMSMHTLNFLLCSVPVLYHFVPLYGTMGQSSSDEGVAPWDHHTKGIQGRARRGPPPRVGVQPLGLICIARWPCSWAADPFTGEQRIKVPKTRVWLLRAITQKGYKGEWGRGDAGPRVSVRPLALYVWPAGPALGPNVPWTKVWHLGAIKLKEQLCLLCRNGSTTGSNVPQVSSTPLQVQGQMWCGVSLITYTASS